MELVSNLKNRDIEIGYVGQSPGFVIAIVSYDTKRTYSFTERAPLKVDDPTETTLHLIHDRTTSLTISSSKSSPTGSAQAQVIDVDGSLFRSVTPGDWLMAWILPSEAKAEELANRIRNGSQANLVQDGLKFIGRVDSVRQFASRNADGLLTKRLAISCHSFTELQMPIYYNPRLGKNTGAFQVWIQEAQKEWGEYWNRINDPYLSRIESVIPFALDIFLGPGPERYGSDSVRAQERSVYVDWNQNRGYIIPQRILQLLGLEDLPPYYSSILVTLLGIQNAEYDLAPRNEVSIPFAGNVSKLVAPSEPSDHFSDVVAPLRRKTGLPLISAFQPQHTAWDKVPVWSILHSYINPLINEMFASLKPVILDDKALVLPHITIRQKPFSTPDYRDGPVDEVIPHTQFHSLLTWRLDPASVLQVNLGRSNSYRANYSEVQFLAADSAVQAMQRLVEVGEGAYNVNHVDAQYQGFSPLIGEIRAEITSLAPENVSENSVSKEVPKEAPPRPPLLVNFESETGYATISSNYGERRDPFDGEIKMHEGVDFAAPAGTPVPAADAGTISSISYSSGGYGLRVVIDHGNGVQTSYSHLQRLARRAAESRYLKEGDKVVKGQVIAYVGSTGRSTGPHLHYEVILNGKKVKPPVDPSETGFYRLPLSPEILNTKVTYRHRGRVIETTSIGVRYSNFLADLAYERHLALTGTIQCVGVVAPISVGDNLLFDGVLCHIESITDAIYKDSNGQTTFRTSFAVSHGVDAETLYFVGVEEPQRTIEALPSLSDPGEMYA